MKVICIYILLFTLLMGYSNGVMIHLMRPYSRIAFTEYVFSNLCIRELTNQIVFDDFYKTPNFFGTPTFRTLKSNYLENQMELKKMYLNKYRSWASVDSYRYYSIAHFGNVTYLLDRLCCEKMIILYASNSCNLSLTNHAKEHRVIRDVFVFQNYIVLFTQQTRFRKSTPVDLLRIFVGHGSIVNTFYLELYNSEFEMLSQYKVEEESMHSQCQIAPF